MYPSKGPESDSEAEEERAAEMEGKTISSHQGSRSRLGSRPGTSQGNQSSMLDQYEASGAVVPLSDSAEDLYGDPTRALALVGSEDGNYEQGGYYNDATGEMQGGEEYFNEAIGQVEGVGDPPYSELSANEHAVAEISGYYDENGTWIEGYYDEDGNWVSSGDGWGGGEAVVEDSGAEGYYDEWGNWIVPEPSSFDAAEY